MRQHMRAARVRRISCFALFGAALTAGGAAHGQTLQDALQSTYATNPQITGARAELRVVEEELPQARGGYLPDVGAFAQGTYNDINSSVRADRLRTGEVGVRLRQNLYAGGGTAADVRSATSQIDAQRNILDDTEQGTLLNTVEVFTAVLREQKILDASKGNVERLTTQLDQTERRFGVGEATRTDLAQAQARLIGAQADQRQARANLVNAAAAYGRIVGETPGVLVPPPLPNVLPTSLDEALAFVEANPAVQAANARLAQTEAQARGALAQLLPSLDLEGEASYVDEPSIFTDWQRTASIGLQLNVPLYQRGVARSQLRQAREQVSQRREELASARRQTTEQVVGSFEDVTAANERVAFFDRQVEAYGRALDAVKREAAIGNRPTIDVLNAEQDLFSAQVELQRAIREQTVAAYTLKRLFGEFGGADLGLDTAAVNE